MQCTSFKFFSTFLLLLSFATPASATLMVEGSFRALVTDHHLTGSFSDFGSPALGSEINGTFSYSVEENENVTGPVEEPNLITYSKKDWIHFDFDISGTRFQIAPNPAAETYSSIYVQKYVGNAIWWDLLDLFQLHESYVSSDDPQSNSKGIRRSADLTLWGGNDDLGAIQDFSFEGSAIDASLYLSSSVYFNEGYYSETLSAQVTNFAIASRTTEVPEPSGLLLSSLAFLLIGYRAVLNRVGSSKQTEFR